MKGMESEDEGKKGKVKERRQGEEKIKGTE